MLVYYCTRRIGFILSISIPFKENLSQGVISAYVMLPTVLNWRTSIPWKIVRLAAQGIDIVKQLNTGPGIKGIKGLVLNA